MKTEVARGRRVNKVGAVIAGVAVVMVLGGLVYMAVLAWTGDHRAKVDPEDKQNQRTVERLRLEAWRAPPEEPVRPEKKPDPPKQEEKKPEADLDKLAKKSPQSVREMVERKAAEEAWRDYYKMKAKVEEQRFQTMLADQISLWAEQEVPAPDPQAVRAASGSVSGSPMAISSTGTGRFAADMDKTNWANRPGSIGPNYIAGFRVGMASQYQVMEGTYIPARTEAGIVSGLPIGIKAKVTQNIPCAVPGGVSSEVCIPIGTDVMIDYNTRYEQGECRVQAVATRLIFWDNSSMSLGNMPISDSVGYAGMRDECDTHLGPRLLNAVLFSAVDGAFSLGEAALGANQVSGRQVESVAQGELRDGIKRPPTLTIRPGYDLRIVPHGDILFEGPFEPMTEVIE